MYLKVRVMTGAKAEKIEQSGNTFKIAVKEKPERNLANARVRQILSEQLQIPIQKIRIVSGHHSPSKKFEIRKN